VTLCDTEGDRDEIADRRRSPISARGQSQGRLRRVAGQPKIDDVVGSEMLQGFLISPVVYLIMPETRRTSRLDGATGQA
jgi:hypothetical protein